MDLADPERIEGFSVRVSDTLIARLARSTAAYQQRRARPIQPQTGREQRLVEQTAEGERRRRAELVKRYKQHLRVLDERRERHLTDAIAAKLRELSERDYEPPRRKPFCVAERQHLLRCYRENASDPLVCGELVDALERCSKRVQFTALEMTWVGGEGATSERGSERGTAPAAATAY